VESFGAFEGAALNIREDDMPSATLIGSMIEGGDETETVNIGRPSDREAIVQSFERLYPTGCGSRSWKAVTAEIGEDTGIYVHQDTVKRALGLKN
jgi:hypothetical protein